MKNILLIYIFILSIVTTSSSAEEVIQLKMPGSGKVVFRLVFRNRSISDPAGKEGLTELTADMITESGTKKMTSTEIRKLIYPWAARMSSFTDKEVSIFTFEVPTRYLQQFYEAVVKDLLLNPSMDKNDFGRKILLKK
jgi:zinc protease